MYKQQLLERLENRTAQIGIIGLGYVGLPLAVAFAEVGFSVIGLDVSTDKVNRLNNGQSYIPDISTEQLAPLVQSGKLRPAGASQLMDYWRVQNPTRFYTLARAVSPSSCFALTAAFGWTKTHNASEWGRFRLNSPVLF